MLNLELQPGDSRQLTWVQATTYEHQESFDKARIVAARQWDAERAREYERYESQMKPMVGRWVRTSWAFKKGFYGCGWVKGYEITDLSRREPVDQWYPSYTIVLDRICTSDTHDVLPPVWMSSRSAAPATSSRHTSVP